MQVKDPSRLTSLFSRLQAAAPKDRRSPLHVLQQEMKQDLGPYVQAVVASNDVFHASRTARATCTWT